MEEHGVSQGPAKRARVEKPSAVEGGDCSEVVGAAAGLPDGDEIDDFDEVMAGTDFLKDLDAPPPPEPEDEIARKAFADRLRRAGIVGVLTEEELASALAVLRNDAPKWETLRRNRSAALLLVYVARSPRKTRAAFTAEGMSLLGSVLQENVAKLEGSDASARQEAGMQALAALMCLRALPIGRATMWEHRHSVGKAFDRLHRWCGKERTALAAELRAPTLALCKRWKRQPRPAVQEGSAEQKALRLKVVDMIAQGLMGIAGNSPASPAPHAPPPSPGRMPPSTTASEVEAALFGLFGSVTPEYRQHARMLRSNLALNQNAGLRDRVLSGEVSAEDLVKMDSNHLAPEALQAQRQEIQKKMLKETIVETLVPLSLTKSNSDERLSYDPNMAPPPMVSPVRKDSSGDAGPDDEGEDQNASAPLPMATHLAMDPPPTPFRPDADHSSAMAGVGTPLPEATPEIMPTPGPDDCDEESAALIRYLTTPI